MVALRQDQKPGIVGHQVQSVELVPKGPADPLVANAALQRRCSKTHQHQPVILTTGNRPEGVPNLRQGSQVMDRCAWRPETGTPRRRTLDGRQSRAGAQRVAPVMDNITPST